MEKLLVVSCVSDDSFAPISMYLLKNYLEDVKAGVAKYAENGYSEVMYLLPEKESVEGLDAKAANSITSPVLNNPYAIAQVLTGNLPRPMIQDDFVAEYEGKEIAVITPEVAYGIKNGFVPDGYEPVEKEKKATGRDYTWKEMISSKEFYVMIVLMCCGAFMGMMIISQASPIAQKQIAMDAAGAAAAVSVLALFNTGGRILGGFISDLIGQINTLTILLVCSIFGLLLLVLAGEGDAMVFYPGVCVIGLCFGGFMGIYPGFTNERFGAKYAGINFGIMFIGFAFSGFVAPMTIGRIFAATGSFVPAYFVAMALSLLGIVLTFVYRKMK